MPLRKATQAVISPNICTTDTAQTITGAKSFSSAISGPTSILSSSGDALTVTNTGTGNSFRVNDSLNDSNPFVITNSGNVGIGSPTADAKLYVSGNVEIATDLLVVGQIDSPTINAPSFQGEASGSITSKVVQGVTDGSVPVISSYIGEVLEQTASPSISTGLTFNAIVFQVPAGVWSVQGQAYFNFSATAVTASTISVSLSDASAQLQSSKMQTLLLPAATTTATPALALVTPTISLNFPTQGNYYLVIKAPTYTGTITCTATIRATRIR